ncbi:MAG TPA: hypothetical protein VFS07_10470, partial [Gemmatimonadales bacterium]|nr:hypothetical protein [Gemmatimonadales bacterium]
MPTPLLLSLGAWALGLLLSALAWWSPDGAWFPSPLAGFVLLLVALVLFLGGMLVAGLRLRAPKASTRSLFGAAAPFFAAAVAVTLAAHGLLPHPALPLVVTVAGGLWGRRLARGTGAPVRWPGELGFGAAVLVALLIGIPAILVGVGGQVIWQLAAPRYDVPAARLASTRGLEAYRPAPAPDVTAAEAGLALLAVAQTGDTAHSPLFVRVPGASARAWVPADDPFAGQGGDTVLARASRGLTPAERAWLAGVAAHPGFAAWATVARAPALDPWAGLKAPLPPDLSGVSLPLPSYVTLRAAARAQLYRVALAVAERRTARADSLARELVGFGLRLRDDADPLVT